MLAKQPARLNTASLTIPVDLATAAIAFLVLPALIPQMSTPSGLNALLLSGGFLVFCLGVILLRRLDAMPNVGREWPSRGWRTALALFFALVISMAIALQFGFFESSSLVDTRELGEGGAAVYFVFAPGAWLGLSLLYVLAFAFNVTPSVSPADHRYMVASLLGLVAANAMLVILAAQVVALDMEWSHWAWSLAAMLLLAALFLPPRLQFLARTVGARAPAAGASLAVFLALLILCATAMFWAV